MSREHRKTVKPFAASDSRSDKTKQFLSPSPRQENIASDTVRFRKMKHQWWIIAIIICLGVGLVSAAFKYFEENKNRQISQSSAQAANNKESSFLSEITPFAANPTPTPVQLAKEYIYAGSRVLAVEDANANAASPADLAVWRPLSATWYVLGGQGSQQIYAQWGTNGDKPVVGDYDGDGKTDFSVFRPAEEKWYIQRSSDNTMLVYQFGLSNDRFAQADYDGDGKTDAAVFRDGYWYVLRSSDTGITIYQFGLSSDKPVAADYDGDGKADFAVWRGADWILSYSSNNQTQTINWQLASDQSVANDYDGDGEVDIAVWRETNGTGLLGKAL